MHRTIRIRRIRPPLTLFLALIVAFVAPFLTPAHAQEPTPRIQNPATATGSPVTIPLEELWRVGGDGEAEGEFFGVISAVDVDPAGTVYLLDRQLAEVKLFSPDGAYIRTIGREGEGPGEFRQPIDMFLTSDGKVAVIQIMPGKIVLLDPDGTPVGDYPLPEDAEGGSRMTWAGADAGERIVVEETTMSLQETKGIRTVALVSYAKDDSKPIQYFTSSTELNFGLLEIDERVGIRPTWAAGVDGKVYVVPTFGDYVIDVYRPDGGLERIVERNYEHLMRTEREKALVRSRFIVRGPSTETKITVSEHHPDIHRLYPREDGTLWVLTSRGRKEPPSGALALFDVYDAQGHFVRQVTLQGEGDAMEDGIFMAGDRLYLVTNLDSASRAMHAGETVEEAPEEEEELGAMEVICYRLDGKLAKVGE